MKTEFSPEISDTVICYACKRALDLVSSPKEKVPIS